MRVEHGSLQLSPSDVTGFLACEHLTALELEVAAGRRAKPGADNAQAELIRRKGMEHETGYLRTLRRQGLSVVEIATPGGDWDTAQGATAAALRSGVDVVYQGVFCGGGWRGIADFLVRVEEPSALGPWSYEAVDTKLARTAKPSYLLQLLYYSDQLARLQRREPREIHVLLGSGERQSFRARDFAAFHRRVRARLEAFVADPPATEPYPVAHCAVCDFLSVCEADWEAADHLSRVAGIARPQIAKLEASGLSTLAALGSAAAARPASLPPDTWLKLHEQAELQLAARTTGVDSVRILRPTAGAGFALLPAPSPGDLFFDFEGNPFWDAQGSLEYLWGILDAERRFTPLHAHDHDTERAAFEQFVDLVHERLAQDPQMHVYHYAQYEIVALRRLMGRYGTREAELDDLLRRDVFVDLYRVVRNAIRTSRPGYGLKELEAFLPIERNAEVKDGGTSIVVFEQWMQTREPRLLEQIDEYNREDCVATLLLRDWLVGLAGESADRYGPAQTPPPDEPRPLSDERRRRAELRQRLLDAGETLAAELLHYHERERKPGWWAFYDRLELTPEELVEDAESIGKLEQVGGPEQAKRSKLYTLGFPPQEHKIGQGQNAFDPATGRSPGAIVEVDRDARRLVLKRGPSFADVALPQALIPGRPYDTKDQEGALERLADSLLAGNGQYPALEGILRRTPFDRDVQTADLAVLKALLRTLDGQYLVIQGPPGSGKTWTSGRLIADLLSAGSTVGVASTSHKAIHNLLDAVEDAASESGLRFVGLKKASAGNPESFYGSPHITSVEHADDCVDYQLLAGTAWLFSRVGLDRRLDYLFVDEAGQVSLADALAMATSARNVVLVGDPQQLAQVVQGTHPAGSGVSVLEHLIGDVPTVPPNRGVFLERTFRLHPDVCRYISEEFYESRLVPAPSASTRTTPFGTGLRFLPVGHVGRRQESPEEAAVVAAEVERLLRAGLAPEGAIVVAAYNAQVGALRAVLPETVRVGTVDKFQGQEADVVFYSMASSSGEDVPRGLEFLLSRNRLNVAISRARCLAYLVASPRLLEVECKTIPQMRLANALCRFVELAAPAGD